MEEGGNRPEPASQNEIEGIPVFKLDSCHCNKDDDGLVELPTCAICQLRRTSAKKL